MMMNSISRRVWLASVLVLCLSAATAWADTPVFNVYVPGVNPSGNLDNGYGTFLLPLKVNINTNKGTFTASGHGTVTNLSGAKQEYVNIPVPIDSGTLTGNMYKVNKKGKCDMHVTGIYIPAP